MISFIVVNTIQLFNAYMCHVYNNVCLYLFIIFTICLAAKRFVYVCTFWFWQAQKLTSTSTCLCFKYPQSSSSETSTGSVTMKFSSPFFSQTKLVDPQQRRIFLEFIFCQTNLQILAQYLILAVVSRLLTLPNTNRGTRYTRKTKMPHAMLALQ